MPKDKRQTTKVYEDDHTKALSKTMTPQRCDDDHTKALLIRGRREYERHRKGETRVPFLPGEAEKEERERERKGRYSGTRERGVERV